MCMCVDFTAMDIILSFKYSDETSQLKTFSLIV